MKKYLQIIVASAAFFLSGAVAYAQESAGNPAVPGGAGVNRCQLFVPNAFTPNGDDINDRFEIKYNEECQMERYELKIFDRWGRLVFEIDDPDLHKAWNGTSEGKEQKEGVYMWQLYAKLVDPARSYEARVLNKHGTVVLIR